MTDANRQDESAELWSRIRRIEIACRRMVQDRFAGGYHSVFKGRGMAFDQIREYMPGDDVRQIDWNATARFHRPYIKLFTEERELTVLLLVDVSASMYFGSAERLKRQLATEFCATIALSAMFNNDNVGLVLFSDRIESYLPPKKGRRHVMRLIHELLVFTPSRRETNVALAVDHACRLLNRRGTLFVVSDFVAPEFERSLLVAGKRHDSIAVTIADRYESRLGPSGAPRRAAAATGVTTWPTSGLYQFEDPETGEVQLVDLGCRRTREALAARLAEREERRSQALRRAEADEIRLLCDQPIAEPLLTFFRRRARRMAQGV